MAILSSILGSGIPGFLMSGLTALFKGRQEKKMKQLDLERAKLDNAHELKMLEETAKNQKVLQNSKLEEIRIHAEANARIAESKVDLARQDSLTAGIKISGTKMASFISSVRPIVTYSFTIVFLSIYIKLAFESDNLLAFLDTEFATNMNYLFASIITFWFGNRMIDKRNK